MDAEPREPVLLSAAHLRGAGLDPGSGLTGGRIGRRARNVLRRRGGPPAFEGVERSRRIATRTAANELNNLVKLARPELSHDLVDAPLIEQQNSRYHRLGHTLSGGPPHRRTIENDSESIGLASIAVLVVIMVAFAVLGAIVAWLIGKHENNNNR
jgi:hypothetical protein